jgi:hypothetical protein
MFKLTFEVNGREVEPDDVGDALQRAIMETVEQEVRARVAARLDAEEMAQLTMILIKAPDSSYSMRFNGPEEVIAKVQAVFES